MTIKELMRRLILASGYEIRHRGIATADPFQQQRVLLAGVQAPIIFDVGENIGTIAQKYRHVFPGAKIYAFEPFLAVFQELECKVSGDKDIIPCNLALGSAQAAKTLRVNASSATNSLLETADSAASFWGGGLMETTTTVEVEVGTVDKFCRKNQIERIDVLKMDTQGTELEILKGGSEMLSEGRIDLIFTELIVVPTYSGQSKLHELMGFLDAFGYGLSGLYNLWSRGDGRLLQMDAIFAREERGSKKC